MENCLSQRNHICHAVDVILHYTEQETDILCEQRNFYSISTYLLNYLNNNIIVSEKKNNKQYYILIIDTNRWDSSCLIRNEAITKSCLTTVINTLCGVFQKYLTSRYLPIGHKHAIRS